MLLSEIKSQTISAQSDLKIFFNDRGHMYEMKSISVVNDIIPLLLPTKTLDVYKKPKIEQHIVLSFSGSGLTIGDLTSFSLIPQTDFEVVFMIPGDTKFSSNIIELKDEKIIFYN